MRALALAALAGALACRPSPDRFYDKPFPCDAKDGPSACGKNRDGGPMTCFSGRQIGLRDFCVDQCEEPGETEGSVCLESRARLRKCRPSQDGDPRSPHGPCNNPELSCLRTDLLLDEGVCVMGTVCSRDSDCKDPARSTCAASVVKNLVPSPHAHADHLHCVQYGCQMGGAACSPGESCLPNLVMPQSKPLDVCVPHCDSALGCPPNHFCYRKLSPSAASPSVCLSGLPSFRCNSRSDCLVGDCVEVLPSVKTCSVPCTDDASCWPLEQPGSPQICGTFAGGRRYCVAADFFTGSNCLSDSECPPPALCTRYSPYATSVENVGYCLLPCQNGACASRAGLPHTCFDFLERPVCYPGKFGLYCSGPGACMGDLQCLRAVELEANDQFAQKPICTLPCASDADCAANHLARVALAYCEQGFCVMRRRGGRLCQTNEQCDSGKCQPSERVAEEGTGVRRCTYPPGGAR
jgi:hypothetical protein